MTATCRKVILDVNFVLARGCPSRLSILEKCGCSFVLTDTAVLELCTSSVGDAWRTAQSHLKTVAGSVEVWLHSGELLANEVAAQSPTDGPVDSALTARFRESLLNGNPTVPHDLLEFTSEPQRQRERVSLSALIEMCDALARLWQPLRTHLRREVSQRRSIDDLCYDFVNGEQRIREYLASAHGRHDRQDTFIVDAANRITSEWYAYQQARSSLALLCVYLTKFDERQRPPDSFVNTYYDADYAALLKYADAIATNELRDMRSLVRWTHGTQKKVLTNESVSNMNVPHADIAVAAYYVWDTIGRGHGHDVSDWLCGERRCFSALWDSL